MSVKQMDTVFNGETNTGDTSNTIKSVFKFTQFAFRMPISLSGRGFACTPPTILTGQGATSIQFPFFVLLQRSLKISLLRKA